MKSGPDHRAIKPKILISRRTAGLLLGSFLAAPANVFAATSPFTNEIFARSQLSNGDPGRPRDGFANAHRGEPITLGVIGGSITVGAFATTRENSYAGRLLTWWREKFPRCDIRMVNAGVGGTGSMYGALRAGKDLLSSTPDFVVIEFAVNDNWTDGEAFEGLVRQILAQPNLPAVLLLFMMWEKGGNDQEMQAKVGAHYQLPMVSFRDALWPEMAAGGIAFDGSGTGLVAVFADPLLDPRRIRFRIDGASFQTLDALKQPKRPILVLAQDLTPERHIVELVDDDGGSGRAAGQQARLIGIAGIGLKDD